MNEELTNDEVEIDLVDLGYVLLDKWRYLLISLIAGAVLLGAYSFFFIAPTYESTAKLYVVSASDDSVVNLSDLNLGTSLTADYEQLMLSYPVLNRVIDRLNLDATSDELAKAFSLNNPSDTRILEITATSTDPQMAMDLAETMAEEAIDYLPDTMSTLAPNLAQHAKLPESKVAPSYTKFTMIGALLGLLICAVYNLKLNRALLYVIIHRKQYFLIILANRQFNFTFHHLFQIQSIIQYTAIFYIFDIIGL